VAWTKVTAVSTAQHSDGSYASKSNNYSNSSASKSGNSNKHEHPEGAISGLSKLKRKLVSVLTGFPQPRSLDHHKLRIT
jgi:hypothetical protein